jgi:diguanylate cyclase (GGDEF)-like protein/PAS domain S-box-containing protein/putative nucleotidyltransferase with HDIG domain
MKRKPAAAPNPAELRRQAEAKLSARKKRETALPATEPATQRLVNELQVHQIELQMQNEELVHARAETEALLRQYADLYDFAPVGYFTLARDGTIHQVNLAGARLLGVEASRLITRPFGAFVPAQSRMSFTAFLDRVFKSGGKEACEIALVRDGSTQLWAHIEATSSDVLSEQREVCRAVVSDITVRRQAEEELRRLSTHDALTGAYSRNFFVEEMERVERGRRYPVSIVMADVDGLTEVNDRDGHAAGDALLRLVAQVLTDAFRSEDVIARMGGDEFAVLLPATGVTAADASLRRVRQVIEESNATHTGTPICLSLGVSTAEHPAPLSVVLRDADANMYRDKRGRDAGHATRTGRGQDATELRRRSEAELSERAESAAASPTAESDTWRLVHELQLHQIELETRNQELVHARAEIEAALHQYADLYDHAPAGWFTLTCDGTIRKVNAAGAGLLGVKLDGVIDRRFGVFVSVESRPAFSTFLDKVFATRGGRETCEVALAGVGPEPHWAQVEASTDDGQECRAVVVDITARKQAEDALQHRLAELEALHAVSAALRSARTRNEVLPILLDEALAVMETETGAVWLYHPDSGELRIAARRGRFHESDEAPMKPGAGIVGAVFASAQTHVSAESRNDAAACGTMREQAPRSWSKVCVPIRTGSEMVGVLFVSVPPPRRIASEEVNLLESLAGMAGAAIDNAQLFDNLQRANLDLTIAYDSTIEGWSRALDLRDRQTEGHTLRVTEITMQLARAAGIDETEFVHIRRGALLHDIGKMGVPDDILLKPDKLTDDEWVVMRKHPQLAFDMSAPITHLKPALDIPYCHHERWDGTGYPRGLKGEQIPPAARLFAVVDVWDALRSDRPYREAWPEEKVLEHIKAGSGTHFDPQAVELFMRMMNADMPSTA